MMDDWTEPPSDDDLPGSCDWGFCDDEPVAWRWDDCGEQWLPVCVGHQFA